MMSSTSSTTSERFLQNGTSSDGDPIEFLAFLVWYIFLVLCCLIPTCCAYRRRRIMERRLAEQQATMQQRLQQSNLLFLSNFANESAGPSLERVRTQLITDDLASTTMKLESHQFVPSAAAAAAATKQQQAVASSSPTPATAVQEGDVEGKDRKDNADLEAQMEHSDNSNNEEHTGFVRLPNSVRADVGDNTTSGPQHRGGEETSRLVSDTCTICLCQYDEGESVTWSTRPECVHAFHTQCIISCKFLVLALGGVQRVDLLFLIPSLFAFSHPGLAKQDGGPQCPVCRQEFCSRSFLPVVRQEDEFLRTIQQALLLTQLYGGRNNNNNNGRNATLGDIQLLANGRPPAVIQREEPTADAAAADNNNGGGATGPSTRRNGDPDA
jgi:hypothetical protein